MAGDLPEWATRPTPIVSPGTRPADLPEGQQSKELAEEIEAAAAWFSRKFFGASSVRRRDREYARQVVEAVAPILVARVRADVSEELVDLRTRVFDAESALAELVRLKDGPRDEAYERDKPLAWSRARAVLAQIPAAPAESVVAALPDPLPRCAKCGSPLGACATCGMPAQCGEAFCVQHTDPPDWSPPALPDVVGTPEPVRSLEELSAPRDALTDQDFVDLNAAIAEVRDCPNCRRYGAPARVEHCVPGCHEAHTYIAPCRLAPKAIPVRAVPRTWSAHLGNAWFAIARPQVRPGDHIAVSFDGNDNVWYGRVAGVRPGVGGEVWIDATPVRALPVDEGTRQED